MPESFTLYFFANIHNSTSFLRLNVPDMRQSIKSYSNKQAYMERLAQLRQSGKARLEALADPASGLYRQYLTCQANVKNLLGPPSSGYQSFFADVLFHWERALLDQFSPYAQQQVACLGKLPFEKGQSQSPYLFCTFHLGSYRLINFLLAEAGIPYSLVVQRAVFQREKQFYTELFGHYSQRKGFREDTFELLNAEDDGILRKMIGAIRRGHSLLLYMDGNTGAGRSENLIPVNFLGKTLKARQGIAYLSHLTGTPIVPVINRWTHDEYSTLEFMPPIFPDEKVNREVFCKQTTQKLYDLLAFWLQQYPSQWEGWLYVHSFLAPSAEQEGSKVFHIQQERYFQFNADRFSWVFMDQVPFLFDNLTCHYQPLSQGLLSFLQAIQSYQLSGKDLRALLKEPLLRDLVRREVLVETGMASPANVM